MRILLWHGYLLGGTGSNVYTRMLAREWSRAGHDVTVLSPGAAPRARTTSALRRPLRPDVGGLAAGVRARPLRGLRRAPLQDCTRDELDGWVEANAAAVRDAAAGRPRVREPRAARRPGRGRDGRAVRRQGARLRARVLDARQRPSSRRGARRRSRGARGDVRRLGAHPRGARRGVRARRARARGAARGRRRRVGAGAARARARRRCSRRRGATRRTPATPRSACPTRATPTGSRRSSPATRRRSSTSAS